MFQLCLNYIYSFHQFIHKASIVLIPTLAAVTLPAHSFPASTVEIINMSAPLINQQTTLTFLTAISYDKLPAALTLYRNRFPITVHAGLDLPVHFEPLTSMNTLAIVLKSRFREPSRGDITLNVTVKTEPAIIFILITPPVRLEIPFRVNTMTRLDNSNGHAKPPTTS
jgi:hypothetical protein